MLHAVTAIFLLLLLRTLRNRKKTQKKGEGLTAQSSRIRPPLARRNNCPFGVRRSSPVSYFLILLARGAVSNAHTGREKGGVGMEEKDADVLRARERNSIF